jgi:menaquinone-dependent protoporphyrinogen oxidase
LCSSGSLSENRGKVIAMKILVSYASGYGATAEVAKTIAHRLQENHEVDLVPSNKVRDLEQYDAIVIGSSLRAGRWLGTMNKFLRRYREQLIEKPLAIFTVCLEARTMDGSRRVLQEHMPRLMKPFTALAPVACEAFGGVLDFDRYNFAVRTIMRNMMAKEGMPTSGFKDYRDWESIHEWADGLVGLFSGKTTSEEEGAG